MKKEKTIYIFGNELLDFDNTPIKLQPELEKLFPDYTFIVADPNENLKPTKKELLIIDTVEGIDKVMVFNDVSKIENTPKYSMHDFDLGFNLKLLHKIGDLEKVTIFGIPMKIKRQAALEQLADLFNNSRF